MKETRKKGQLLQDNLNRYKSYIVEKKDNCELKESIKWTRREGEGASRICNRCIRPGHISLLRAEEGRTVQRPIMQTKQQKKSNTIENYKIMG